jgi:hypothetical protein
MPIDLNDSGFEVTDKVFVKLDGKTYHGTVIKIDCPRNRIKVDYTAKSDNDQVKDWFPYSFWKKLESQKIYISTTDDKKKHLHTKFHATAKATNGIHSQRAKNKNRPRNPIFHARKLSRPKK